MVCHLEFRVAYSCERIRSQQEAVDAPICEGAVNDHATCDLQLNLRTKVICIATY